MPLPSATCKQSASSMSDVYEETSAQFLGVGGPLLRVKLVSLQPWPVLLKTGIALMVAMSPWAHGLDVNRLWLPIKYQTHYLSLVEAATVAEALERCVTVVEGTLDLEQSVPEHPIYRIQCRQANGRTYNEMVDGLSFDTLTTVEMIEPEPTEEELERLRIEEERRRQEEVARRKREAWQLCQSQLIERTQLMSELQWLADITGPLEPDSYSDEEVRFSVGFDARSMWREPLHYMAECSVSNGLADVVLRKR